jgi:hypothetical protein
LQYHVPHRPVNGGTRRLRGASLAQIARRKCPIERAILGAELVEGRVVLEPPTARAACTLVGVSYGYVLAALKLSPEQRNAVLAGERPLIEERSHSLPAYWANADTGQIVEAIRLIGVDRALTAAIAIEAETSSSSS